MTIEPRALPPALLAMTLAVSCAHPSAQPSPTTRPTASAATTTSTVTAASAATTTATASAASTASPASEIHGSAVGVRSYCGGTPPTQAILRELRTPRPEPSLTLLFRRGETSTPGGPVAAETRTDAAGRFAVHLPPGTYCVVDGAKRDRQSFHQAGPPTPDPACLDRWLRTCDSTIEITPQHHAEVTVSFERGCGDPICVPISPRP